MSYREVLIAIALICLVAVPAQAEPVPNHLIPPDVTLSPGTHQNTSSSTTNRRAPGMPGAGATSKQGQPKPPPRGAGSHPAASNTTAQGKDPVCVIDTNKGRITIRLFQKYAPKTVAAFVSMVKEGFYNNLTWHRYEPGFVIQGGCPKGNGTGMYIDPKTNQPRMLFLESTQNLKHNSAGVVAMAHFPRNPHSASCQFYITLKKQPNLDFKYTIFGGVIDGLEVVFKIRKGDKINSITMIR